MRTAFPSELPHVLTLTSFGPAWAHTCATVRSRAGSELAVVKEPRGRAWWDPETEASFRAVVEATARRDYPTTATVEYEIDPQEGPQE